MKKITLKHSKVKGLYALVDDRDYARLSRYEWKAQWSRVGKGSGMIVDHKNRVTLDNRRANLRAATKSQNCHNRRLPSNQTGYKGVRYVPTKPEQTGRKRYHARISLEGTRRSLGYFRTAIEAARAYNRAALKEFGKMAVLNNV